jgi:hypothetical protein
MTMVPASSGRPTSANSKKLRRARPGIGHRVGDQDVLGRAGERQVRARAGGEGERHQHPRRAVLEPHDEQHHDRQERPDRAARVDQRAEDRDRQHRDHLQPGPRARDRALEDTAAQNGQIIGTSTTETTKNHTSIGRPNFQ